MYATNERGNGRQADTSTTQTFPEGLSFAGHPPSRITNKHPVLLKFGITLAIIQAIVQFIALFFAVTYYVTGSAEAYGIMAQMALVLSTPPLSYALIATGIAIPILGAVFALEQVRRREWLWLLCFALCTTVVFRLSLLPLLAAEIAYYALVSNKEGANGYGRATPLGFVFLAVAPALALALSFAFPRQRITQTFVARQASGASESSSADSSASSEEFSSSQDSPSSSSEASSSQSSSAVPPPLEGTDFHSAYFDLSFTLPTGFEVRDSLNSIAISQSPYVSRGSGDNNIFMRLARNGPQRSREIEIDRYKKLLNVTEESTVTIDGSRFPVLRGNDWGRFDGDSAGRVTVVFFDVSLLEIIERPMNADQDFDPIETGERILSTFRFSKN